MCSVTLADGEPVANLTVEWLNASGSVVESGSGTTQLTHTLNPLLPSHGGEYRCRATLQGGQELLEEDTVNVIVSGLSGRDCVEQTNGTPLQFHLLRLPQSIYQYQLVIY